MGAEECSESPDAPPVQFQMDSRSRLDHLAPGKKALEDRLGKILIVCEIGVLPVPDDGNSRVDVIVGHHQADAVPGEGLLHILLELDPDILRGVSLHQVFDPGVITGERLGE